MIPFLIWAVVFASVVVGFAYLVEAVEARYGLRFVVIWGLAILFVPAILFLLVLFADLRSTSSSFELYRSLANRISGLEHPDFYKRKAALIMRNRQRPGYLAVRAEAAFLGLPYFKCAASGRKAEQK